jgi:hypothetical protein
MLTRLGVELALGVERSTRAFQEKVGAFPSRQLTFGSEVSSHVVFLIRPKVKTYFLAGLVTHESQLSCH